MLPFNSLPNCFTSMTTLEMQYFQNLSKKTNDSNCLENTLMKICMMD